MEVEVWSTYEKCFSLFQDFSKNHSFGRHDVSPLSIVLDAG